MNKRWVRLAVDGIALGAGALLVERSLSGVQGVLQITVSPATGTAYVEYDPTAARAPQLLAAIESAGFKASVHAAR